MKVDPNERPRPKIDAYAALAGWFIFVGMVTHLFCVVLVIMWILS